MSKRTSYFLTHGSKVYSKPPKNLEELFNRPQDVQIFQEYVNKNNEFCNFVSFALKIQTFQLTNDEQQKNNVFIQIENRFLSQKASMPVEIENKLEQVEKIKKLKTMKDKDNFLKDLQIEVLSVLRYLFLRFKKTDEWKTHINSTYTFGITPLFQEEFEINNKYNKRKSKINGVEMIKVRNLETNKYCLLRKFAGTNNEMKEIKQEYESIFEKFKTSKHPNVLQMDKIFDESNDAKDKRELYYIFKEISTDLTTWINCNEIRIISQIEMIQHSFELVSALNYLHENGFYFPVGKLNEKRIYSDTNFGGGFTIDIGFLNPMNSNDGIQIFPPEYDKNMIKSPKYDIFSLGIILLRMITGIDEDDIKEIFSEIKDLIEKNMRSKKKENPSKPSVRSPRSSRSRSPIFKMFYSRNSRSDDEEETEDMFDNPKYEVEVSLYLSKLNANNDLKKMIMDMLSNSPKNRPSAKKLLEKLTKMLNEHHKEQENLVLKKREETRILQDEEEKSRKIDDSFILSNFIYNKKYAPVFKKFLEDEFSSENLEFIEEIERFKSIKSNEKRIQKSKEITHLFMKKGAKFELNVKSKIKVLFFSDLESYEKENECPMNLFDGVVDEVIITMIDSYFRFQLTNEYKELYDGAKRKSRNSIGNLLSSFLNME
eukprot:gene11879-5206_t